jgi:hypothetical protein
VQAPRVRLLPFFISFSEVQTTLSFLLVLKPLRFGLVQDEKFEKLTDLYNIAVEEVVRLVKKNYTFSLQLSFSEGELMGLALSHWANHIDPKDDKKNAL